MILLNSFKDDLKHFILVIDISLEQLVHDSFVIFINGFNSHSKIILNEILIQIEGRNMAPDIDRVDFDNPNSPEIVYNGRFTFVLGRYSQVSQKFAILSGALQTLKAGDAGVVDLSDGIRAVFSPN